MKRFLTYLLLIICSLVSCVSACPAQGARAEPATPKPEEKKAAPQPERRPAPPRPAPRSAPTNPPMARTAPAPLPRGATTADLTINAYQAGATVLVNGKTRGLTNHDGLLNVSSLKPGQYIIIVRKPEHREQQRSVSLAPGQSLVLEMALSALPGRLSVTSGVDDALIEVGGSSYHGQVSNLELEPGSYEVKVSKAGYRTEARTVVINTNTPTSLSVPLAAITVEEMLSEADAHFASHQYARAIAVSEAVLAKQPEQPHANLLTGLSYFYTQQYAASTAYLQKALAGGEVVILPIRHHHKAWVTFLPSDALCTGVLTIGRGTLSFKSLSGKDDENFSVPASKLGEIKAEPNKAGRIHVEILVQKSGKKKEEKSGQNFQTSHTSTRRNPDPNNTSPMEFVYCDNCQAEMQTLYELLMQLKQAAATVAR